MIIYYIDYRKQYYKFIHYIYISKGNKHYNDIIKD